MSEELIPCPFCEINDWQYHAHFSGATIRQCGGCGTIIDESIINTHPIEDDLRKRIAELERDFDMLFRAVIAASKQSRKNTQTQTFVYGKESEE